MTISPRAPLILAFACSLLGCASVKNVEPGPDGYNAIKFLRTVQVRDHAINLYTFPANAVFIEDRFGDFAPIYCGQATINDDPHVLSICVGIKGSNVLVLAPGSMFKEVDRVVPNGSFNVVKVKI